MSKLDEHKVIGEGPGPECAEIEVTLREGIAKIPGEEGWWKSGAQEGYEKLALDLLEFGATPQQAVNLLHSAYWCAAECYGN